jgi:hypothetical protein
VNLLPEKFANVLVSRVYLLKSGVNVTIFCEKYPTIGLLTAELLQQSIDFHQSSFSRPAVLACELDAVSSLSTFRPWVNWVTAEWVGSAGV